MTLPPPLDSLPGTQQLIEQLSDALETIDSPLSAKHASHSRSTLVDRDGPRRPGHHYQDRLQYHEHPGFGKPALLLPPRLPPPLQDEFTTSTAKKAPPAVPLWMPAGLTDEWVDESSLSSSGLHPAVPSGETVVRKELATETPNWKRVTRALEAEKQERAAPLLKAIFHPPPESSEMRGSSGTGSSGTGSSGNSGRQPPQHSTTLVSENTLSEVSGPPPLLPWKLFGDRYNTFTKDQLAGLLTNINMDPMLAKQLPQRVLREVADVPTAEEGGGRKSQPGLRALSAQNQPLSPKRQQQAALPPTPSQLQRLPHQPPMRKPSMEDFRQNAENVFERLRQRGFPGAAVAPADSTTASDSTVPPQPELSAISERPEHSNDYTPDDFTQRSYRSYAPHLEVVDHLIISDQPEVSVINTPHIKPAVSLPHLGEPPRRPQVRGFLPQDATLPQRVANMVLDPQSNRWVPVGGAVHDEFEDTGAMSLEDTTVSRDPRRVLSSLMRQPGVRSALKPEVSFLLPDDHELETGEVTGNVTLVGAIHTSFSQLRELLVQVITDRLAHLPQAEALAWDRLRSVLLTNAALDNVAHLDRFLPALQDLDLSGNSLTHLLGVPSTVRRLVVRSNSLGDLCLFDRFSELEWLDVLENQLTHLLGLGMAGHLREVVASDNCLLLLGPLASAALLWKADLSRNRLLGVLSVAGTKLGMLGELDVLENTLTAIRGLEAMGALRVLRADDNQIREVGVAQPHLHLKKLSVRGNRLRSLNLGNFPLLRVLRVDGNELLPQWVAREPENLAELSLRCQPHRLVVPQVLSLARLGASVSSLDLLGNAHAAKWFSATTAPLAEFVHVTVLELLALALEELPQWFGRVFPNTVRLNANHNGMLRCEGLAGCTRLQLVLLVSNRLTSYEGLLQGLGGSATTLRAVDCRLNPLTAGFYPHVFSPQEPEPAEVIIPETLDDLALFLVLYALMQTADGVAEWDARDGLFRHGLQHNHSVWNRRSHYETMMVVFLPQLHTLDGGTLDEGRRQQSYQRLQARLDVGETLALIAS